MASCWQEPNLFTEILGIFLIVAGILSFLPQYYAIWKAKSSHGLSYLMLGAGCASGAFTAVNVGMLNWERVTCCWEEPKIFWHCIDNNLQFSQLFFAFLTNLILYSMFIHFNRPNAVYSAKECYRVGRWARLILGVTLFLSGSLAIIGAGIYYGANVNGWRITLYANVLGYFAAILNALQYIPQIVTTVKLRGPGSLSLVSLFIQGGGQLLILFFQGVLNHGAVSTWLPQVFAFIEMTTLFVLIVIFHFQKKKHAEAAAMMNQPLLEVSM